MFVIGMLCLSLFAGVGLVTGSPSDVYVTVSDVEVSDDEPTTGDTVTVTPTIRHSSEQDGGFQVTQVVLTAPDRGKVDEASDLGSIGAGETIDVPLQTTVETAGEKRLVVKVRGLKEDADGNLQRIGVIERPVYVSASEPSRDSPTEPRLQIDTDRAVAGTDVPVGVTVSNGDDEELTDLVLRLDGEGIVEEQTRIRPTLGAGNMTTFDFRVRPDEAGETELTATLEYGDDSRVETVRSIQVEPLREDVDLHASILERNESTVLQYRVTNRGNAPIDDVTLSGRVNDEQLPGATIATVDAASAETVTIPVSDAPTGTAEIEATYRADDRTEGIDRTVDLAGPTATDSEIGVGSDRAAFLPGSWGQLLLGGVGATLVCVAAIAGIGYRRRQ
ncbi:Transglutaminase domain-containing protein [Natrinema pellirubrum DSM 15624]|uniref:Transglutaminase domain-containing protein n=1 Tax=Natrinema pellirubrum (strain DSM 15624 / CIP 106293 / JCM 10476 / NCIMB 786 / 157) TaxID=797303 RepID=L9Z6D0_NATP1|nr:Transglutaminase domain-containing protein [Natrinema pellirubrum DSM 15624]